MAGKKKRAAARFGMPAPVVTFPRGKRRSGNTTVTEHAKN